MNHTNIGNRGWDRRSDPQRAPDKVCQTPALQLVALGYTNVYRYLGGRDSWEVASLPASDLVMHNW